MMQRLPYPTRLRQSKRTLRKLWKVEWGCPIYNLDPCPYPFYAHERVF